MEWTTSKAKLSRKVGREAKIVAPHKDEAIVGVPEVVRMPFVAVEPQPVVVVLHVEHVEVAVRVGYV